jgi:hypothetical protein
VGLGGLEGGVEGASQWGYEDEGKVIFFCILRWFPDCLIASFTYNHDLGSVSLARRLMSLSSYNAYQLSIYVGGSLASRACLPVYAAFSTSLPRE